MRKIIIVSMFILLASNAPAHASFASIIGKVAQEAGEFVVSKVDDFLNGTLDVLEGTYKHIWNEKPERTNISEVTPQIEDGTTGAVTGPSSLTGAEMAAGNVLEKSGRVVIKIVDREIICKGKGGYFKPVTDTDAVIYALPSRSSKPL